MKNLLTIAGSDSCGGAGIQADIKTFSAHGCYGMSVITAVTAQNTCEVIDVEDISPEIIKRQMNAIFTDIEVDAVKIGMVSKVESIEAIAESLRLYKPKKLVLDPVMVSKSGYSLLKPDAIESLKSKLLPIALIVTPNIPEAEILADMKIESKDDIYEACKRIRNMGAENILIKGGHLEGDADDILFDGEKFIEFKGERINTPNTHGTGCTLSSAIASNLANGLSVEESIRQAKEYIKTAIQHSIKLGKGAGPTNHFYTLYRKAGLIND